MTGNGEMVTTPPAPTPADAYYFGCWQQAGHFLHDGRMRVIYQPAPWFPLRLQVLDSGLLSRDGPQTEGLVTLVRMAGWTVISFWDRSVDRRDNSNSAFVLRGEHDKAAAIRLARLTFPQVFARFRFAVR